MINVKKGIAHSLQQSDLIGKAKDDEAVEEGMLVKLSTSGFTAETYGSVTSGYVIKAGAAVSATLSDPVNSSIYGFALNNQDDGDVEESGRIGFYALDGNSVIETDQAAATINSTNYPIGTKLIPDATATGKVRAWAANGRVIGEVQGIRTIRGTSMLQIKLAV